MKAQNADVCWQVANLRSASVALVILAKIFYIWYNADTI